MGEFFLSPGFVTMLLLFYWVPFAVGAWFTDVYRPRHPQRSSRELRRPKRHMGLPRPASAGV
jgi:hypothetical protein